MSGKKPVPPKLPKQQTPGSTSQAKNPGQVVPASSVSGSSRYITSTIPRPNYNRPVQPSYSSALASSAPRQISPYTVDDPFGPIQSQPQKSSQPLFRKNRSPYFKKPYIQHISYIEPHIVHIKDPLALAMEVFPEGWHFLPKHPEKNIKYYRQILIEEESARIEDIMNKRDPSAVLYHKFIITGFINSKEWGQHPSLLRTLRGLKSITGSNLHYSYHDYMDAFEKVLYYQNKQSDHSWFIMFDKKFSCSGIPVWFLKWWDMFGSVPQIFPEPLQDALRYFSSRSQALITPHGAQFPAILHMTVMYRIHWISMWNYEIKGNLLDREFSVKWWDSLKIDTIISQVHKDLPPPVQRNIVTRSQSSLDSFAGKSSKELKDLAHQLLLQSEELQSQERGSPVSSEASANFDPNDPLFQDSQDPNDAYRLDSP
ncbi:hypothetical protein SO802_013558 [Lithocarpus litseifolius]|uniref:Uncharacterized protein n=1 Tax=Lithocarpus litseifolius TaxID=425828 RepID=A0AAW2D6H8_9ROSI